MKDFTEYETHHDCVIESFEWFRVLTRLTLSHLEGFTSDKTMKIDFDFRNLPQSK